MNTGKLKDFWHGLLALGSHELLPLFLLKLIDDVVSSSTRIVTCSSAEPGTRNFHSKFEVIQKCMRS